MKKLSWKMIGQKNATGTFLAFHWSRLTTAEAQLIAICCSTPPDGRSAWTVRLLADAMAGRGVVVSVGRETVRKALKKNALKPWLTQRFCIPERDAPRFVAQMEQVLDVYQEPPDPDEPLVCMDEASKALHADKMPPLPMARGTPSRADDKYERDGTAAIFMFVAPHMGWRRASCREHRTRADWAE